MVNSFIHYSPYSTSDYEKKARQGYHKHDDKKKYIKVSDYNLKVRV